MPYYPIIYVTSDGKYKPSAMSGKNLDELKVKAMQRKQEKGYVKVYIYPKKSFDTFQEASKTARQWLRELKAKWKEEQLEKEQIGKTEETVDLTAVRDMLPGLLATLTDHVYHFLKQDNVAKVEVIIRTHHIDGTTIDHETDVVLEKEEDEE